MPSINDLPPEIILAIVLETPSQDLPALALVSRSFYFVTNTELYRFVYYWEPGPRGYTFSPRSLSWPPNIHHSTRIFNLDKVSTTLREAGPEVQEMVKAANLDWQNDV